MRHLPKFLVIVLLLATSVVAQAQCYERNHKLGETAYSQGKKDQALLYFKTAQNCPDKPKNNDLASWINKCQPRPTPRPSPSQQFSIDGKTSSFSITCGAQSCTRTFSVSNNAESYSVVMLPSWCSLEDKSSSSFKITFSANEQSDSRTSSFVVQNADGKSIEITVTQSGGAVAFTVDGQTAITKSITGDGGVFTFNVSNPDYDVRLLPSWCSVEYKGSTYFNLRVEANTGGQRSDWFKVYHGSDGVRIDLTQSAKSLSPLEKGDWRDMIATFMSDSPHKYSGGDAYKGETNTNGGRTGLGCYRWNGGEVYFGGHSGVTGKREGSGIFICSGSDRELKNCHNCTYFVGRWSDNNKSGKGTCYDAKGNLIYYGDFSGDSPTGTYPSSGYTNYKFECIEYTNGDRYVGETKDGKRHGQGIFLWASGGAWYGRWIDGERDGYGVYIGSGDYASSGTWKGDTKQ